MVSDAVLPLGDASWWHGQRLARQWARRLAPRDTVEAVPIEVYRHPDNERLAAPLAADPTWLKSHDETVRRLARHIRDSGETCLVPILVDALEDAGCTDVALLDHRRWPHENGVRNWVVELLATQK